MQKCPVCETEYIEGSVECCPTCNWDLTPYPLMFQIPESFIKKEQNKLAWAKQMWLKSQKQAKLTQTEVEFLYQEQAKLKYQVSDLESKLEYQKKSSELDITQYQSKIEHLENEKLRLQNDVKFVNKNLSNLSAEYNQSKQQLKVCELEYSQERSNLELQYQNLERRSQEIETQLKLAKNFLSHWLPDLNFQLAQEILDIPDKVRSIELLESLIKSSQNWRHVTQIHKITLLKTIKSILETDELDNLDKIREHLYTSRPRNSISYVDAILSVRHELKQKAIIKRDIDGDTLYD